MILTERKVPFELMYIRAFSRRAGMDSKDVRMLSVLEGGYEGELHYDRMLLYSQLVYHRQSLAFGHNRVSFH